MVCTMVKSLIGTTILAACFALLILSGASCRKSIDPKKLTLADEAIGPAPNAANVIKIDAPIKALPAAPAETQASHSPISPNYPAIWRHWLMLLGALLLLFLLSLMLFHTMGRQLHKPTFRVHPPTRHANIWASHNPPQFLDP